MTWTTLSLQVTTPLFNGGAYSGDQFGSPPAHEAGIRVASLRGAMRFWFRALAGSVIGPDLNLLSTAEQRVFGSTERASPVLLRIPVQPAVVLPSARHNFLTDRAASDEDCRWIIYLMGQSLGDMRNVKIRRSYVAPGQDFKLKVGFRHHSSEDEPARAAIETLVYASLLLMCAYGGAGARTRRGFGGLRITAAEGPLPAPWNASTILTPSLAHYEELRFLWPRGSLGACMTSIPVLTGHPITNPRAAWQGKPPSFPVLSSTYAPARVGGGIFSSWQKALADAGQKLRRFRADRENANARYRPKIETREWPDVVHGGSSRFQLGALGLPVVYKDGVVVNAKGTTSGDDLRRASPLWLRPVGEDKRFQLLSFAFNTEFLPEAATAGVYCSPSNRRLSVTDQDMLDVTGAWIEAMAADDYPERPPTRQ